jgi:hypothetical protein
VETSNDNIESRWDMIGMVPPESILPTNPYTPALTWESLVSNSSNIFWSDEPEPEWLTEAMTSHPRWEAYAAQPVPPLKEPESEPEPELESEPPVISRGKKKKGKGPPPAPTPKKVKAKHTHPPPPPPRPRTPPPEILDHPLSLPAVFHVPKKAFKVFQPLLGGGADGMKRPQMKWADFERVRICDGRCAI